MREVWAFMAAAFFLLIVYAWIASSLKSRRQRREREKSLPFVADNVSPDVPYNIFLSDGKKYLGVQLVGTSDAASGQFAIGGWEGMLVMRQANGKRIFVRQASVRCIEEA